MRHPKEHDPTETVVRDAASRRPLGAIIGVLGGKATPRSFQLANSCVLGSGNDCDVVVSDNTVSRRHVELTVVPEGVLVRDLGSRNGTFYLGQRVEKMVLAIGGRITLAATATVTVEADTESLNE